MNVLMPLPQADFDPSEAAVSWKILHAAGHDVTFATPDGCVAAADPVMLSGIGLDFWGRVPVLRRLRLVGLPLRANRAARAAHRELVHNDAYGHPLPYAAVDPERCDALLLPGGHARGMREYLESGVLHRIVAAFFDAGKPVLHGRRTTALTWALERSAWNVSRYAGRWWDRDYYRTYVEAPGEPTGYRSVQAEVTRALARPDDFLDVAADAPDRLRKTNGLFRDSLDDARPAFVVRDGNYVSARWPGDVHTFARTFAGVLSEREKR